MPWGSAGLLEKVNYHMLRRYSDENYFTTVFYEEGALFEYRIP